MNKREYFNFQNVSFTIKSIKKTFKIDLESFEHLSNQLICAQNSDNNG